MALDYMAIKEHGVTLVHHFSDGLYAKETIIPAGNVLTQHEHSYDHLSIIAKGSVNVEIEGVEKMLTAPVCLNIEKNKQHRVTALTDVVWFCIHATDEKDAETIDESLIRKE